MTHTDRRMRLPNHEPLSAFARGVFTGPRGQVVLTETPRGIVAALGVHFGPATGLMGYHLPQLAEVVRTGDVMSVGGETVPAGAAFENLALLADLGVRFGGTVISLGSDGVVWYTEGADAGAMAREAVRFLANGSADLATLRTLSPTARERVELVHMARQDQCETLLVATEDLRRNPASPYTRGYAERIRSAERVITGDISLLETALRG